MNDYQIFRNINGNKGSCYMELLPGPFNGKPFNGKTVVVTHFAPHRQCVARQHEGSDVSPYFVTDLSWLMGKYRIDLWCYGHTHTNSDFVTKDGCRIVSNQKGYPNEGEQGFRPDLVIEV